MTRGSLKAESNAVQRAVELVKKSPGINIKEAPAILGLSFDFTRKALQVARSAGLIRAVQVETHTFGWFPVGSLADEAERKWKTIAKERERKRNRVSVARWTKRRRAEEVGPELPGKPIRKRVKASKPLPFVCIAPASVFHLGGML